MECAAEQKRVRWWLWIVFALLAICTASGCRRNLEADLMAHDDEDLEYDDLSSALDDAESELLLQRLDRPKPVQNDPFSTEPPPVIFGAPEFRLTDQDGNEFGTAELRGKVWLINFMFTNCTATCPQQTARLLEVQYCAQRWPDKDRLSLVSVTVDPKNDTVDRLRQYASSYHADTNLWKFLTGNRDDIYRLSKDGFKCAVSEDAKNSSSPITHSSRLFLVDSTMRVRGFYDAVSDEEFEYLLSDLRTVLGEHDPKYDGPLHIAEPDEVLAPRWMRQRRIEQLARQDDIKAFCDFKFEDKLESTGITFVSRCVADVGRDFKQNHYDHANGVIVADVDLDGWLDVYFMSQVGGNELWRNLGNGRFENITESAGVAMANKVVVTASFADTDNDGDPDLYVTTTRHGNAFFENDGKGHFRDITKESGLEYSGHSSGADFFDYDRDGLLDLFVTNVGIFTTDEIGYSGNPEEKEYPYYIGSKTSFGGHLYSDRSETSILYHNDGNNQFRDVTVEEGLVDRSWTGDATPMDVNEDGWVDLYVLNMQGNDEYFENIQGERFERKSEQVFPYPVWGGMGVKSFDYNNDSRMDLYITNMHADMWQLSRNIIGPEEKLKPPRDLMSASYLQSRDISKNILGNGLYRNQGEGKYEEVSDQVNAETFWPWGPSIGDLNADGYQDIFLPSCMNYGFRYHPNSLLLNEGGEQFRDAEFILGVEPRRDERTATVWYELDCNGPDSNHRLCKGREGKVVVWGALGTRAAAIFDLDQDGDLDIVTNDFNSPPMVLISDLSERKPDLRYLSIRLRGTQCNRDALGTKVQVIVGDRTFTQVHDGQSGYLSQSSMPLYFGLGDAEKVDRVIVHWLGGEQQVLEGPIEVNQQLEIEQE